MEHWPPDLTLKNYKWCFENFCFVFLYYYSFLCFAVLFFFEEKIKKNPITALYCTFTFPSNQVCATCTSSTVFWHVLIIVVFRQCLESLANGNDTIVGNRAHKPLLILHCFPFCRPFLFIYETYN